jgi:hypothetical protein
MLDAYPSLCRQASTADSFYDRSLRPSLLRVAVIDWGINPTHVLLAGKLGLWGDCSTTSSRCNGNACTGNCCRRYASNNTAFDVCSGYGWPQGSSQSGTAHGTAVAALVAGNENCDQFSRGASTATVRLGNMGRRKGRRPLHLGGCMGLLVVGTLRR